MKLNYFSQDNKFLIVISHQRHCNTKILFQPFFGIAKIKRGKPNKNQVLNLGAKIVFKNFIKSVNQKIYRCDSHDLLQHQIELQ